MLHSIQVKPLWGLHSDSLAGRFRAAAACGACLMPEQAVNDDPHGRVGLSVTCAFFISSPTCHIPLQTPYLRTATYACKPVFDPSTTWSSEKGVVKSCAFDNGFFRRSRANAARRGA